MRWIAMVAFVLGLALGYLLGAAEERPALPRGERGSEEMRPSESSVARESGAGATGAPAVDESSRHTGEEPRLPEVESRPLPEAERTPGQGRLVVEIGNIGAWSPGSLELVGTGMRGAPASESLEEVDDGLYRIDAYAGRYSLEWWADEKTHRIGVDIRAGEVRHLRLDAGSVHHPAPVPAGFGRLTVRLLGVGGVPLPNVDFLLVGRAISREEVDGLQTDSDGEHSLLLRPGTYELRAGGLSRKVTLRERNETTCVCDHARAGEIHLPEKFPGTIQLRRPASIPEGRLFAAESNASGVRHWVFVTPGTYEYGILLSGQRGHGWGRGTVTVAPGQVARLDPDLPGGSLTLEVELDPTPAIRKAGYVAAYLLRGDHATRTSKMLRLRPDEERPGIYHATAVHLPEGSWVVSISPAVFIPVRRPVTIGEGAALERVRLVRKN